MIRGWIKLYRKITDNEIWTSEIFTRGQAMVDLIILANHKDGFIYKRGNRINIARGQVGWSQLGLGDRWKWSRPKVKKFLTELESDGFLLQQNNRLSSLITIINYNDYQSSVTTDSTTDLTTEKQQKSNRPYSNNNDKKEKNGKKTNKDSESSSKRFIKPTLEQVQEYITEKGYDVDAVAWMAKYESNGWLIGKNLAPMKNWKSAVVTWEQNNKKHGEGKFI